MRWLHSVTDSVNTNLSKLWEIVITEEPGELQSMGLQRVGHNLTTDSNNNKLGLPEAKLPYAAAVWSLPLKR